jgi:hypothetical protein
MLLDLHVGRPLTRGGLTLFPVWNGAAVRGRGYDLGAGGLQVVEHAGHAAVQELVVTNTGPRPALILEGELLEGGQQHRVAARSVLVAVGGSAVLEVRCVEEGRWSGSQPHRRTLRHAPVSIRAAQEQGDTWERVRSMEARHGGGDTHFLGDSLRAVEARAARLVADFEPLPFQSGLLLGIGGQPVQLEAYDSPRTLAATWSSLIHAAALDAVDAPAIPTPGRRARRFLQRVHTLAAAVGSSEGDVRRSQYACLTCLTWRGRAVHTVAVNTRHELVNA